MKRSGFTLVELIFVIVIIGVLAAVAVPKYQNLKQNAEVNGAIKTTIDAAQSTPSAFVNLVDLEGLTESQYNNLRLDDLIALNGKGWSYSDDGEPTTNRGTYTLKDPTTKDTISQIKYFGTSEANRTINYEINCTAFNDSLSTEKCNTALNAEWTSADDDEVRDVNITF